MTPFYKNINRHPMNARYVTWLQALYLKYFCRYAVFRWCKPCVVGAITWATYKFRQLLPYSVHLFSGQGWWLLLPKQLTTISTLTVARRQTLESDDFIEVLGPRSFNGFPSGVSILDRYKIHSPFVGAYEIQSAIVMGNTNFVIGDWGIAYPDIFDIENHACPAEILKVITINLEKHTGRILPAYKTRNLPYKRAISILNQCSSNYIHWLLETLPQLTLIDQIPEYDGLPILVDGEVHPNIMESLRLLNSTGREIIPVAAYEPVMVESLIVISPPGYVPYEPRSIVTGKVGEVRYDELHFSPMALCALRQAAWRAVSAAPGPDRIYLRRQGLHRPLINSGEIEALVRNYGFEVVVPDVLSFREQVSLFRNAKCIISPVGAGLGNMIFAPSGCRVVSMGFFTTVPNFYFFDGIAKVLGHRHEYVLGPYIDRPGDSVNHRSYSIDVDVMRRLLDEIVSEIGRS